MTRFAIVLGVVVLSLCAVSTAEAARTEFFGIVQKKLDDQDLQGMAAARVRTERFQIGWKLVEPSQGTFDWRPTDRIVGGLASHGIRPFPFVWGSPPWVRPGPSRPPVGSAFAESAWRNFLKAAVARYGPGGSYWATGYRQRYGASATPLPIQSWQIWNEPNLQKYFDPGGTSGQGINKYAQLVKISHDAIKSQDPDALIVLAGLLGRGNPLAWDFLSGLYEVPGFKNDFDVAALHPYTGYPDEFRRQILEFRGAMTNHGDGATPLWLTEFAWGSAPRDRFGINKGPAGQAQMLSISFGMILRRRSDWNVQRLYWFLWRDPPPSPGGGGCSFCGSAGLLRYNRDPKPAYYTFRSFATEWVPPRARFTGGPSQGGFTQDSTPSFSLASNEPGSTFECRIDAGPYKPCSSPYTLPQLSDGPHAFFVKAIDAPGNESQVVSRSFTVDTDAPAVTISSGPVEGTTSSDPSPSFGFASNDSGASLSCQLDGGGFDACSSPFTASGLADGPHTFQVKATDLAQNTDLTSRTWTVDTHAPTVTMSSGPANGSTSSQRSPSFGFASNEPASLSCELDGAGFDPCSSPFSASGLADGSHTFQVKATDTVQNTAVASRTWTVAGPADVSIIAGPVSGSVTKDPTPSFSFSSLDSDSDFRCRIDGASFASCASPLTTSRLSDREHTFIVKATDAAQTTDLAWRDFTVDTTAPAVTIKGHVKVWTKRKKASATFTLRASERVDRRCRIDSRRFKPCSVRYSTPRLRRGTHTLKVKATDRVGHLGAKRMKFRIARKGR
ncbi:MAG: hypothetical protein AABM42_11570 [Actinomycetota bacterium]